jgi:hypothetical protein
MKVRACILAGLLLALMAMATGAATQDTEPPCVVDDVLNTEHQGMVQRDWLNSVIITLNANIEDADTSNFLSTARELRRILTRLDANCRGMRFTNESEGMQPVIGPIPFTNGIWRATLTTAGFASVKIEDISGTCEDDGLLFNSFEGDAADGAQKVFTSGPGCEVLIEMANMSEDWELTFELVKATDQ